MNGIAKEYDENHPNLILFEGLYKKGLKNGISRGYYQIGKLKFEGKLLNGEKQGIYKEYDYFGRITFEIEFSNGKIIKK